MKPDSVDASGKRRGLTDAQVEESRAQYGRNILTPPPREPWWKLLLSKFDDPVIRILMIAAVLALGAGIAEGHYAEGIGIIVAILLATVVAFFNEYKAAKEFDILNKLNEEVPVQVIRNGHNVKIPKSEVVVGDLVFVEVGQELPADGTVVSAVALQVSESRLTGEAEAVRKIPSARLAGEQLKQTAYPADRVLRGTIVADGHGELTVTDVGDRTEIGKAVKDSSEETEESTPLTEQLEGLGKLIGVVGFGAAALAFTALLGRGVVTGELVMTPGQWLFTGGLIAAVVVGLCRVWLPIIYDGLEFAGSERQPPEWLENGGVVGWLKTIAAAVLLFAVCTAACVMSGVVSTNPEQWIKGEVASELLKFFMIAVTIIVVAVPEGLAMSVTLSLAYAMRKMTASNTLVRRMHACETIGAATVICSDKTGTLTRNEMSVFEAELDGCEARTITPLVAEGIAANSTAHLNRTADPPSPLGNPTEAALLLWMDKAGVDYATVRDSFAVEYQWTFSTERKFMATIGTSPATGSQVLHVKGAPEIVLARCTSIRKADGAVALDADRKRTIEESLRGLQARGMRTLALAYRQPGLSGRPFEEEPLEDLTQGLVWLGFVAIADPLRVEVPAAVESCRKAGVSVKIVTGDNPQTAQEIASQLGLWRPAQHGKNHHVTGPDFDAMSDDEAIAAARDLVILSRAKPKNKLRLVHMLQRLGQVVAVTGDGVNDGPALNHANVGLAMGKSGTDVAKEASDIVLLDDSFRSVVNAIKWGRSLYENIQRFILFQLTINVAALTVALLGPFIGVKIPLTVTQMLWVNLIMDTFAALALATEPPHESVMDRSPRDAKAFIVTKTMWRSILTTGISFVVIMVAYLLFVQRDGVVTPYEMSYFFTGFVLLQFWNLFNARCLGGNQTALAGLFANPAFVMIAIVIFVGQVAIAQFGGEAFRTVPLTLTDWVTLTVVTSAVLWVGETIRFLARSREKSTRWATNPSAA